MSKRNVVHVEIPAANVAATSKFYQDLLGWKIQHDEAMNYSMWEADDGSGGGFPAVSADNPAGQVLVYIDSDDIEADLKRVEKLGGKVIRPKTEIPNINVLTKGSGYCYIKSPDDEEDLTRVQS